MAATAAPAQEQERGLRDRIEHPNMDLHASGYEKTFSPAAAGTDKSVSGRSFGFARAAGTQGNGWFHNGLFASHSFRATAFSTKQPVLVDREAIQGERTFGTRPAEVLGNLDAGKAATVQGYQPSGKLFISHGKRQEEIDDLRRQKQLSIDQVREILNKNK